MGGGRCSDVGFSELAGKRLPDGDDHGNGDGRCRLRRQKHRAAPCWALGMMCFKASSVAGARMAVREFRHHLGKMQLVKAFVCTDEEIAIRPEPLAFNRRKPLAASIMPAAVQRNAIARFAIASRYGRRGAPCHISKPS